MNDTKQFQSIAYAARRLNKKPARIYEMIRQGILPPGVVVRFGRQIFIDPEQFEEFCRAGGKAFPGGWRKQP